jgi:hypothetical protein
MSNMADHSREIPVEYLSLEECAAKLSRFLSRGKDYYPSSFFSIMAHVILSPFTAGDRKIIYEKLGTDYLNLLKHEIEIYLSVHSPTESHSVVGTINPVVPADLTMESFPLGPARQVVSEIQLFLSLPVQKLSPTQG